MCVVTFSFSQPTSPAAWHYPSGTFAALRIQPHPSAPQTLNSFRLKWVSHAIAGDLSPLIGDLMRNAPLLPGLPYAPLEIVAAVGGKIVTLDAKGKMLRPSLLPPFAMRISFIVDSNMLPQQLYERVPGLLFLETAEAAAPTDSFAIAYIVGYDSTSDTMAVVTRLTYDLRPYIPNIFAWVKPLFALPTGSGLAVYSSLGMTIPQIDTTRTVPFLRGVAVTRMLPSLLSGTFPIPDAGDNVAERFTVAPHVGFQQASIVHDGGTAWTALLPCMPGRETATIRSPYNTTTQANNLYMLSIRFVNGFLATALPPIQIDTIMSALLNKPLITPYAITLRDAGNNGRSGRYILIAEAYRGRDSSYGTAQLHLMDSDGTLLTSPRNPMSPPFRGRSNQSWSIALGDLDGTNPQNELLPFYPNNPGPEIVFTESTRDHAIAGSRLIVLRYRSGTPIPKPSPAGSTLAPFDTTVTFPLTGWLAAVADLDSSTDNKAEILIADGSDLLVLRLRDYSHPGFRTGVPFDTALIWSAPGEEITNVAVADVDGDARLDIIVTTTTATYLLGSIPTRALRILTPDDTADVITTFCPTDTIALTWRYIYAGPHRFNIAFQPYTSSQPPMPIGPAIMIARNITVVTDTARWLYSASMLRNSTGRFIIWMSDDSTVRDSSGLISILPGYLRFDSTAGQHPYTAGTIALLSGQARCLDSIAIQVSFERGRRWFTFPTSSVIGQGTFLARINLPCIAFPPLGAADTLVVLRGIGYAQGDSIVSDTLSIRLAPIRPPLSISLDSTDLCCRHTIRLLPSTTPCDTAVVFVQYSPSQPPEVLDTVRTGSVVIPTLQSGSNTVRIIWNCLGSCIRTDTVITPLPPFFQGIAPNPVTRGQEHCQILSTPPRNSTITIRIFDQSERLVHTLVQSQNRRAKHLYCDVWDCRSSTGELVPPGMYYVVAESSDGWRAFEALYVR